tara:strand:+ start:1217 stop:2584 length:1368 start_codon:yes stop_codon:yes gene_type:complete
MNIKIVKSTYVNKDNKRAIIFDCSSKNYRKKITTGIFVENEESDFKMQRSISLQVTMQKLAEKRIEALNKYNKYKWTNAELEAFLKKGIDVLSLEQYVLNTFIKNKNAITAKDYINVVKVFKKHLKKTNISLDDILEENTIFKFKTNALKNGVKPSSINSYIKKMGVIMNGANLNGLISKNFKIPRHILDRGKTKIKNNIEYDKGEFINCINSCQDIYQLQSISIFLMLTVCGGMNPTSLMNYEVFDNSIKSELSASIIYEKNCHFIKFRKSNKGEINKYVKVFYVQKKIVEMVKTLFYITHYKKYPFIISSYSNQLQIFDFNISIHNNIYRNLWNFYQTKIKEISNFRFSDAKKLYYQKLNEIEMNKTTSDILFARSKENEILTLNSLNNLKDSVDKSERKVLEILFSDELLQVIINKSMLLGINLNELKLNQIRTPLEFSAFLIKIKKYHKGL